MAEKKNGGAKKNPAAPSVSAEEFVKTWQACKSSAEAKEKLGDGAGSRAARMRKAGVNLKTMPGGGRKLDVAKLNALIA